MKNQTTKPQELKRPKQNNYLFTCDNLLRSCKEDDRGAFHPSSSEHSSHTGSNNNNKL